MIIKGKIGAIMKNKCKCQNKCEESIICIEKIVHGPMGLRGATGATGATGPATETIEVRSTNTIDPSDNAEVMLTKEGNTNYLDFYIPRGFDGVAEVISAGEVETIDPDLPAEVIDRKNEQVHYFDFRIPRGTTGMQGEKGIQGERGEKGDTGEKGEKGDKGDQGERGFPGEIGISPVIVIDGTETLNPDEEAEVHEDVEGVIHHLLFRLPRGVTGAQGEKGERGEKGETGEFGPPGLTPDYNGTIYNSAAQTVTNEGTLTLPESDLKGITTQNNGLIAPFAGTYLIYFSINNATNSNSGEYVAININDVISIVSKRPITTSSNSSGMIITNLQKNDVVTLKSTVATPRTLSADTAPSASLTMILIATN